MSGKTGIGGYIAVFLAGGAVIFLTYSNEVDNPVPSYGYAKGPDDSYAKNKRQTLFDVCIKECNSIECKKNVQVNYERCYNTQHGKKKAGADRREESQ